MATIKQGRQKTPILDTIKASIIKSVLLNYYKRERNYHIVCTETYVSDGCLADVVAINKNEIIEIEIKTNNSDLQKDKKKRKHQPYKTHPQQVFTPNKFYFCVPIGLIEKAKEVAESINPKYGILSYNNKEFSLDSKIIIIKRAKKIKKNKCPKLEDYAIKRAVSELVYIHRDRYKKHLKYK